MFGPDGRLIEREKDPFAAYYERFLIKRLEDLSKDTIMDQFHTLLVDEFGRPMPRVAVGPPKTIRWHRIGQ